MKILIVKTSSLGDIIQSFPVIDYLKFYVPNAEIDWVVEAPFADLVQAHPFIQRTHLIQSKNWRRSFFSKKTWKEFASFKTFLQATEYDLVIDLQGNTKSAVVTYCARSRYKVGFAKQTVTEWPNLLVTNKKYNPPQGKNIREDYLFLAKKGAELLLKADAIQHQASFTEKNGTVLSLNEKDQQEAAFFLQRLESIRECKVLVCSGSTWSNKQLSEKTLSEFLRQFSMDVPLHFFFVWGGEEEKKMAEKLHHLLPQNSTVLQKMSLPLLQNVMRSMDLILAMDSLPLHLAETTSTPTYSFFGPSLGKKYAPLGERHGFFQGECPYALSFDKRCSKIRTCSSGACLKEPTSSFLYMYFRKWWKNNNPNCKIIYSNFLNESGGNA